MAGESSLPAVEALALFYLYLKGNRLFSHFPIAQLHLLLILRSLKKDTAHISIFSIRVSICVW